ncbi:DNA repair protein RecO, partial [Candidatus Microgenomates bacterium]|nr:DNA repair protein RecO [Candidatus Microgenomates bacterium]
MQQSLKTNAFVLRKKNLPSQDIFLSLFTEESGKMSLIAKGIKKITSKRQPHIQTGNLIEIIAQKRHDRYYLQDTKLVSAFSKIKSDETKMKHLYLALFLIDRMLPENQQDLQLYANLQEYLIA